MTNYFQVLKAIKKRDLQDAVLEKTNRQNLIRSGLSLYRPKRIITIDTGKIEGVERVAKMICDRLKKSDRVIALEGISGSGKSATADCLAKKISAIKFSFGELFRYLAYLQVVKKQNDWQKIFHKIHYNLVGNKIFLFDQKQNITKKLALELRSAEIERMVPKVASKTQKPALELLSKEISRLADFDKKIILEGRAFTLDFLPSDVRIQLRCDVRIRAKRRLKQIIG